MTDDNIKKNKNEIWGRRKKERGRKFCHYKKYTRKKTMKIKVFLIQNLQKLRIDHTRSLYAKKDVNRKVPTGGVGHGGRGWGSKIIQNTRYWELLL